MIHIQQLKSISKETLKDLRVLMSERREDKLIIPICTLSTLKGILKNKDIAIIVAKDGERLVGVASLHVLSKITKRVSDLEDLVVLNEYRRQGIGEGIVRKMIEIARAKKITSIRLTSRPEHLAAHKLYDKLGFKIKETDQYRLSL